MAGHVVYQEGLDWLSSMTPQKLFETASAYIYAEKTISQIIESISQTSIAFKKEVSAILKHSGPRYLALKESEQ